MYAYIGFGFSSGFPKDWGIRTTVFAAIQGFRLRFLFKLCLYFMFLFALFPQLSGTFWIGGVYRLGPRAQGYPFSQPLP